MRAARAQPPRVRVSLSWVLLLIGSVLLGAAVIDTGLVRPASNLIYDSLAKTLPVAAPRDVVIVAIDDESLAKIGAWPWPRSVHAAMVARLATAHPRAVLYDVLFTEPTAAAEDQNLADALRAGPPTVLPVLFEVPGRDGKAISIRRPVAPIDAPSVRFGHAALSADADGISRAVSLFEPVDGQRIPHVALLASGIAFSPRMGTVRIAFPARGSVPTVPFAEVLAGHVPAGFLAGKTVLVGATAPGLGDRYATPVNQDGSLVTGVEILAAIVGNAREGRFIADSGFGGSFAFVAIMLAVLATGFMAFGPLVNIVLAVALSGAMLMASAALLATGNWCDPAPALLSLLVLFPAWGWSRLHRATRAIDGQLLALRGDAALLDRAHHDSEASLPLRGDWLARQVAALDFAIAANVDLRQFVQISFDSLPDPAIVVGPDGMVVLANREAHALFTHYAVRPMPPRLAMLARALIVRAGIREDGLNGLMRRLGAEGGTELSMPDDRFFALSQADFVTRSAAQRFRIFRLVETTRQRHAERDREQALEFLSHDLRGPQASIIGLLDGQSHAIEAGLSTRLRSLASRTLSMAQAFIDIARAQSGIVDSIDFDLCDVVRELIDGLWPDFKLRSVRPVIAAPIAGLIVRGDPLLVSRAIENLVRNALKFSAPGAEVVIRLQTRGHADGSRFVACLIDDRGPGIPAAAIERIFDRFQSGFGSGGTGLGLAMVKAAASRFGGRIRCYSRVGVGTRFVFELPRQADDPATDVEPLIEQWP